jgi:adenosylhomocysteine nucleosidase
MKLSYKLRIGLLSVVLILSGCATSSNSTVPYGPKEFDTPGYTALVVAYSPEMQGMLETIEQRADAFITETVQFKGVTYRIGQFQGEPILLFATGMSIANAAMTMQMAFDYFPVKEVVYMGIAGAVNPRWLPGDVIVPERWYYHDESVYSNPNPDAPGEFILPDYYATFLAEHPARRLEDPHLPDYKPFAFVHPDEVLVIKEGMDKPEEAAYFSATPRLLEAAQAAADSLPTQKVGEREVAISVGGNGVTGSVFLDNREYRKWTREVFLAEVTEMESAAIGQVCYINDVDWVIIRAVSDLAGGQEGVNEENLYDVDASLVGAQLLFALLDGLN